MSMAVRKAGVTAAVLCSVFGAAPAFAQNGKPFEDPPLQGEFPGGGSQATPTPTPSPTRTPEPTPTRTPRPTPTATASPSPTPTATPKPKRGGAKGELPNTGSDPLRVGLMGLTLLGFGISVRLRVFDARRDD